MLNAKKNFKRLISSIYECQKNIIINRHFIREILSEGNGNNTIELQNEITFLQWKIIEFQTELKEWFKYSC
jgi:hypothetical protein